MKKSTIVSTLCIALLTTTLVPMDAFAKTEQVVSENRTNMVDTKNQLEAVIDQLGAQSVSMQADALTLLQQPNMSIADMPELSKYLQRTKESATNWLDTLNKRVLKTNQNMMAFGQDVESYYDTLSDLATRVNEDEQARADFARGIQYLQSVLADDQNETNETMAQLADLRQTSDYTFDKFSADVNESLTQSSSKTQEANRHIVALTMKIQQNRDFMIASKLQRLEDFILVFRSADSLTGLGKVYGTVISTIVNSVEVQRAADQIIDAQKEINEWESTLNEESFQLTHLNMLKQIFDNFRSHLGENEATLRIFGEGLGMLEQDMNELVQMVNKADVDVTALTAHLSQFKQTVMEIATHAEKQANTLAGVKYQ
ncbi:HBL/NHE enterotoxin family protein [Bacillus sp. FSL W7-1360]